MDTDVLVIGGGISGCSLAYFLAKEGVEIILLEKSGLNSQASGANSGSIHGQIPHDVFLEKGEDWALGFGPTLGFMAESVTLWKAMEEMLGADLEFRLTGGLLVAGSDGEMQEVRRKIGIERKFGIQVEVLDKKDLQQIAPYISESMVGGAFYPEEGKANPLLVTPAFANQAERYGVKIIRQTEVESIAIEGRGFTANTTKGAITCRRIGNCAGADAARIGAMVGLKLAVRGHPIQVSVTEPIAPVVEHLVYSASDRLTLKQTRHGSCIIGGGWPSGIDPVTGRLKVESDSMMRNLQIAIQTVPRLRHAQLVRTWPAVVNGTENWRPILGEASNVKGFVMNIFPWMGFTAGPASSRVIADLMLGRRPSTAFEVFLEMD